MTRKARYTAVLNDLDTFHIFSDFCEDQTDLLFVDTVTDSGTVLMGDAARGVAALTPSDGTVADNDEVYLATPNENFIFASGRPLYARVRLQFTETASGIYNAAVGFANAVAANLIVDDGAGLRASGCIVAIEKRDGETKWRLTTRNGSTVSTGLSQITAGGAAYQTLEIEIEDFDAVNMVVTAFVDGVPMRDSNNFPLRHFVAIASATEMQGFMGAKLGAITNNDVLNVDFAYFHQLR